MSTELRYGDAAAMAIWLIKNDADFAEKFPGTKVRGDRRGATRAEKYIMVIRNGGVPVNLAVDHARIDVHCYAKDRDQSHDMAQEALLAIKLGRGSLGFGLRVNDVVVEQGVTDLPDPLTGDYRHFFSVGLYGHAHSEFPGAPSP